jgi:hypothetical protein
MSLDYNDNPRNILGANNANNQYDSSLVIANPNGSIIERIKSVQDKVGAVDATDNILGANNANNGFDSSLVVPNENGSIVERAEYIQVLFGTLLNSGGSAKIGSILGDPSNTSFASRLGSIQTMTDKVGSFTNSGGSSFLGPILGDTSNIPFADRLRNIQNYTRGTGLVLSKYHPNFIEVTADMSSASWNAMTSHQLFDVTGLVHIVMMAECTGALVDDDTSGKICLGVVGAISGFIGATSAPAITSNTIWMDNSPGDVQGNYSSVVLDKVVDGLDIVYSISNSGLSNGILKFKLVWEPLGDTGNVVAGTGI